jgi:hypothetical protein
MTQQARFRSECMDCINDLKTSVEMTRTFDGDKSMITLLENIRFFLYCRNGDIPKAKLSYDKMMIYYQDLLDEIMYGEEVHTEEFCFRNAEGSVWKMVKGQDAQAVEMGKVMMKERETLAGWLVGAIKYGHK